MLFSNLITGEITNSVEREAMSDLDAWIIDEQKLGYNANCFGGKHMPCWMGRRFRSTRFEIISKISVLICLLAMPTQSIDTTWIQAAISVYGLEQTTL